MKLPFLRPLDRYVASEFIKIFITTALGFPLLVIVIDLTDRLGKYLNRHLTPEQIALAYVYWFPESIYMVLPAAVLFATVFTIGSLTRHSELTAAKASGISFYRLLVPIFGGAAIVMLFAFALGELVPISDIKRNDLLEEGRYKPGNERYNFAYSAPHGRVYKIAALNVERRLSTISRSSGAGAGRTIRPICWRRARRTTTPRTRRGRSSRAICTSFRTQRATSRSPSTACATRTSWRRRST